MFPPQRSDLSRGPSTPESLPLRVVREGIVDVEHLVSEVFLGSSELRL